MKKTLFFIGIILLVDLSVCLHNRNHEKSLSKIINKPNSQFKQCEELCLSDKPKNRLGKNSSKSKRASDQSSESNDKTVAEMNFMMKNQLKKVTYDYCTSCCDYTNEFETFSFHS